MSRTADVNADYDPDVAGAVLYAEPAEQDERVLVYPPEGKVTETAVALTEAADDLDVSQESIQFLDGVFHAPREVVDAADLPEGSDQVDERVPGADEDEAREPARKSARKSARKPAARKSTARKTAKPAAKTGDTGTTE